MKLDDDYFANHKVAELSMAASHLDIAVMCFCAKSETDGHIRDTEVQRVAAQAKVTCVARRVEELLKTGRWRRDRDGFLVHDFLEYNPSHEQLQRKRTATKLRVSAWRNSVSNGVTGPPCNGVRNGVGNTSPLPISPSGSESDPLSATGARRVPSPKTWNDLVWVLRAAVNKLQEGCGLWSPGSFADREGDALLRELGDPEKAWPEVKRRAELFAADPTMNPWTVKKFHAEFNGIGIAKSKQGEPKQAVYR